MHHSFLLGGGDEPPTKFSKKKGGEWLDKTSTFKGGDWERGGDFFQRGCNFHTQKLKHEIFNDKKSFQAKNAFFCHN